MDLITFIKLLNNIFFSSDIYIPFQIDFSTSIISNLGICNGLSVNIPNIDYKT